MSTIIPAMTIQVHNPSNLPLIDYRTLVPFQGDLKDLPEENYRKLLAVLLEKGFFIPFYLWFQTKGTGKKQETRPMILDGHQRRVVLMGEQPLMVNGSGETGYDVPYIEVQAENEKEAKEKLLAITAQYGQITEGGFRGFTASLSPDFLQNITFDAIDVSTLSVPVVSFAPSTEEYEEADAQPLYSPTIQRTAPIDTKYDGRGNKIAEVEKGSSPTLFPMSVLLDKPLQIKWKAFKESVGTVSDSIAFTNLLSLFKPQ